MNSPSCTAPEPFAKSSGVMDLLPSTGALTMNARGASGRAGQPSLTSFDGADAGDGEAPSECLGDYELLDIVGRGGMGTVYKARHQTLNRIVALKVTREGHLHSCENTQRFHLEASAVAKLDHPNIVPIYEVGAASGHLFFSMAFIEGKSLAHEVAESPLPPRRAAQLMLPVAQAIAYAHSQGIIHRDLKPDNILLDASDRPRITDFGIAKCAGTESRLTLAGEVIGTPSYMSPEQAQGESARIGPASDVYSLGATLYCLVTGRPPFQAATTLDTLKHVVERDPVPPRQLNPELDRDLETICLKCLQKAPDRRYASAGALAEDLRRYCERQPIHARPNSSLDRAGRWCRRNPFIACLLMSFVSVFLTAFALVTWSYWQAEDARQEAKGHEQAERWERYRANMIAVASAFQTRNVSIARQALDAAPLRHRNWEWRHFSHLLDQSRQVIFNDNRAATYLSFTINHHLLTDSGPLELRDLATGRRTLIAEEGKHGSVRVDPTRRRLAFRDPDNAVIVWDLAENRKLTALTGCDADIGSLQFGDDNTVLALTRSQQIHAWNLATGERLYCWPVQAGRTGRVGYDLGARKLLTVDIDDHAVALWDVPTGRKEAMLEGLSGRVVTSAFNRQGNRFVAAEGYPSNLMHLWDAQTCKKIADLKGHTNYPNGAQFSPDGKRLASCSFDQTVRLWDGMTGAPIATLRGHAGRVLAIAFSPDSARLVSASQDQTVRLWNAHTGDLIAVLCGHSADVLKIAYSADGSTFASSSADNTIRLWDARQAERNGVLTGHTDFIYSVAFHPDGERLASASWDGTIRLWQATTGESLGVMKSPKSKMINGMAVDPAGEWIASMARDNAVRLWDLRTRQEVHHWPIPSDHWQDGHVAFSPGGDLLAAAGADHKVYLWNARTKETVAVLTGHTDTIRDVAFSRDGRWLASAASEGDRTIRIWDVAKKETVQVLRGHTSGVVALAFSADGALLASGSDDRTARIWNVATWSQAAFLKHGTSVYAVAFTPDGSRLASGCADNSIRLWDVPTGQEVGELRGHDAYVKSLVFSPDGTRLASASGDATVRVWDALSPRERQSRAAPNR